MVNNFDIIKNNLIFDSSDNYYHIRIVKKGIVNEDNIKIFEYYLQSKEDLENIKDIIIKICDTTNSTAYISSTAKTFKDLSITTAHNIISIINHKNWEKICNLVSRTSWMINGEKPIYIVNIPHKDLTKKDKIIKHLQSITKVYFEVKSYNENLQILIDPIDIEKFNEVYSDIQVYDQKMIVLYSPLNYAKDN